MDKTLELVDTIYEVTTVQNNLYLKILAVGLIISSFTVVILLIINARIKHATNLIKCTTWITPNESMEAFDNLDYDATPVKIEWYETKWFPADWAILHSIDTQHGENGMPTKSKVCISCSCDFKHALSYLDNLDTTLSTSVLIVSMGNALAATVGIVIYFAIYDAALVAALAANSILVAGPIVLSLWYIPVIRIYRQRQTLKMVDINDACKKSATGYAQQIVPIWSRCWVITDDYPSISDVWTNVCNIQSDEWNTSDKQSVYEKIMLPTIKSISDMHKRYKAINIDHIRTRLHDSNYMKQIDLAVAEAYFKRERYMHKFVEDVGIENKFIRNCQLGCKTLDIKPPSTHLYDCLRFAKIDIFSSERAINAIDKQYKGILEKNKDYYLIIGVFGQSRLPTR